MDYAKSWFAQQRFGIVLLDVAKVLAIRITACTDRRTRRGSSNRKEQVKKGQIKDIYTSKVVVVFGCGSSLRGSLLYISNGNILYISNRCSRYGATPRYKNSKGPAGI